MSSAETAFSGAPIRISAQKVHEHDIPPISSPSIRMQEERNRQEHIGISVYLPESSNPLLSRTQENESDWRLISSNPTNQISTLEQPENKEALKKRRRHKICQFPGCKITASFNWGDAGTKKGIFCFTHRAEGMTNVASKKCFHKGCMIQPKFNFPGQFRKFCFAHKLEGMVNVYPFTLRCENVDCDRVPSFNFPGIKRGRFCTTHKLEGMVATSGKEYSSTCKSAGCTNKPQFSDKGRRPKFCNEHKNKGMVFSKFTKKKCRHPSCSKVPSFNFRRLRNAKFCQEHKLEGMVKVKTPICTTYGCNRNSNYGYAGEDTSPTHCAVHKLEGMIRFGVCCFHPGCTRKSPSFNFEGESFGKFCAEHKESDMIRVVAKGIGNRCAHPTCTEETKSKYCSAHVEPKIRKQPLCRHALCSNPPVFGYKTGRANGRFCSIHKQEGMVAVAQDKLCLI